MAKLPVSTKLPVALDAQLVKAIARTFLPKPRTITTASDIKSPCNTPSFTGQFTNQRLELMSCPPGFKAAKDVAILVKEAAGGNCTLVIGH